MILSKDLYPYSVKDLASRLGVSYSSIYRNIKHVSEVNWTYIGNSKRFNEAALVELEAAKVGSRQWTPKQAGRKAFHTPMGKVYLDEDVPIPSKIGVADAYPFEHMEVGNSFSLPTTIKHALEKNVTTANRTLAPKEFTRRFSGSEVRVWRVK